MKSEKKSYSSAAEKFLYEAGRLADEFKWPAKSMQRNAEVVLIALITTDPSFDRFVWVYDTERLLLKCMMVSKEAVPPQRQMAVLELCARINEGLPFGCMEYCFADHILLFRDSTDLDWTAFDQAIGATTSRVLNLGTRYAKAIHDVIKGEEPKKAVSGAEKVNSK